MSDVPETRYAQSGDVNIAYQVFGEGAVDLVLVRGLYSHVELAWEHPAWARTMNGLGSFARVVAFDRRGSGLSDPVVEAPTLEERMGDVLAVMDAAGVERAVLLGLSEGVPMSILFAATHPGRVRSLVCWGGMARATPAPGYGGLNLLAQAQYVPVLGEALFRIGGVGPWSDSLISSMGSREVVRFVNATREELDNVRFALYPNSGLAENEAPWLTVQSVKQGGRDLRFARRQRRLQKISLPTGLAYFGAEPLVIDIVAA